MLTDGMVSPWKMGASLPPMLYGLLLFMKLPQAGLWLTVLVVLALSVLWYISRVDYSIWAVWPALAGGFLAFTCAVALGQGYDTQHFVPLSGSDAELWLCGLLGLAYVAWGLYEARQTAY